MLHVMGREGMAGILQATNVFAVLEFLDGDQEDLQRIMQIEEVYWSMHKKKEEGQQE